MQPEILSVTELSNAIRFHIEHLYSTPYVQVRGELTNLSTSKAGHCYFMLKDAEAAIQCVLFRGSQSHIKDQPKTGQQAVITGRLSAYIRSSQYQLIVNQLEHMGKGYLYEQYLELRDKLDKAGFFASERKRSLPRLPQRIALITSSHGAAITDMRKVLTPYPVEARLFPTMVQGDQAPRDIAAGLEMANLQADLDLIILTRGGGSFEDLYCFNAETVVRAIVRSAIPVIAAIGHERDTSLAELAADQRAPTPTAAAQLVAAAWDRARQDTQAAAGFIARCLEQKFIRLRARLSPLSGASLGKSIDSRVRYHYQSLDLLLSQIDDATERYTHTCRMKLLTLLRTLASQGLLATCSRYALACDTGWRQLHTQAHRRLSDKKNHLEHLMQRIDNLSPQRLLKKGYTLTYDGHDRLLTTIQDIQPGMQVKTLMRDGSFLSRVSYRSQDKNHGKSQL